VLGPRTPTPLRRYQQASKSSSSRASLLVMVKPLRRRLSAGTVPIAFIDRLPQRVLMIGGGYSRLVPVHRYGA